MRIAALSVLSALLLFGCTNAQQVEKPIRKYKPLSKQLGPDGLPVDFVDVPELKDVMDAMIMDQATILWSVTGPEDAPKDEDGWRAIDHAAIAMIETAKFLRISDLSKDDERWPQQLDELTNAVNGMRQAIKDKDPDKLFEVGGTLDEACTDCHKLYYVEG